MLFSMHFDEDRQETIALLLIYTDTSNMFERVVNLETEPYYTTQLSVGKSSIIKGHRTSTIYISERSRNVAKPKKFQLFKRKMSVCTRIILTLAIARRRNIIEMVSEY